MLLTCCAISSCNYISRVDVVRSCTIGGPKMSGNFVRERQRIIIYVNNTLPLAHEISRHFWAAYGCTRDCRLFAVCNSATSECHEFCNCAVRKRWNFRVIYLTTACEICPTAWKQILQLSIIYADDTQIFLSLFDAKLCKWTCYEVKPGFHVSQFIGDLLSGIAEGENDFRSTKDFIHKDIADELRYMKTGPKAWFSYK